MKAKSEGVPPNKYLVFISEHGGPLSAKLLFQLIFLAPFDWLWAF